MKEGYNQEIFKNADLWANYDLAGDIEKKIPLLFNHIPADVESILDAGCGNGAITNKFPGNYRVVAIDSSDEALKYVEKDKILCSADEIPVANHSFDMVFSSELIEHLPSGILRGTIGEFKRIARKYIYISVPNNEHLEFNYILCPLCGQEFHAYGHLNSFSLSALENLLKDEFRLIWHTTSGKRVKTYNPVLLKLRHKYARKYFAPNQFTVCPHCGNKAFGIHKGNLISKFLNGMNLILPKRGKKYWLIALFERYGSH